MLQMLYYIVYHIFRDVKAILDDVKIIFMYGFRLMSCQALFNCELFQDSNRKCTVLSLFYVKSLISRVFLERLYATVCVVHFQFDEML